MNESDVVADDYYWVWIDNSHKRTRPRVPVPVLVVAQATRSDRYGLGWEGCGTDEGVRVLSIVARVEPPQTPQPVLEAA